MHLKKPGLVILATALCLTLVEAISPTHSPVKDSPREQKAIHSAQSLQIPTIRNTWPANGSELQGLAVFRLQASTEDFVAHWIVDDG